jgi:hypothetical protein
MNFHPYWKGGNGLKDSSFVQEFIKARGSAWVSKVFPIVNKENTVFWQMNPGSSAGVYLNRVNKGSVKKKKVSISKDILYKIAIGEYVPITHTPIYLSKSLMHFTVSANWAYSSRQVDPKNPINVSPYMYSSKEFFKGVRKGSKKYAMLAEQFKKQNDTHQNFVRNDIFELENYAK